MKKVLLLILSLTAVFTLSACDLFGDDEVTNDEIVQTVVENWDGSLDHVEAVMDNMNLESMTQRMTFSAEYDDGYEQVSIDYTVTDKMVTGDVNMLHRTLSQTMEVDGEEIAMNSEVIYVQTDTGVQVYMNIAQLKELLTSELGSEFSDTIEAVGITEDWIQFNFDDSLANVIELEVLKEMMREVLYEELGEQAFYELQEDIEADLGFDFSPYGVDLGLFMDHILNERFDDAEALVDAIAMEDLLDDFEAQVIIPNLKNELQEEAMYILMDLPNYDVAAAVLVLQAQGLEAWYDTLTEEEIDMLAYHIDEGYFAFAHLMKGDLPNWVLLTVLSDEYTEMDLREIPGFDYDLLMANIELVDFTELHNESLDLSALFEAMYNGQASFDQFLTASNATAPNMVLLLEPLSGYVEAMEEVKNLVDDISLGFENLDQFSQYFDLTYYEENGMATTSIEATDDNKVKTNIEIYNYGNLFEDFGEDLYAYLDGFSSFEMPYVDPYNCPSSATYCEMIPVEEIKEGLNMFGSISGYVLVDPAAQDKVEIYIDFKDVMNEFMVEMGEGEYVDTMEMTMVVEEGADITLPNSVTNMNEVLEDFAMFSLNTYAFGFMNDLKWDFQYDSYMFDTMNGTTFTVEELEDMGFYVDMTQAFSASLSTITVGGSMYNPTIEVELFWVDGTKVFDRAVTMAELDGVLNSDITATSYSMYLDLVAEENFNLTKLFLVFVLEDDYSDDVYYEYD